MLDTSAVIGWVELGCESVVSYLSEHAGDEVPRIHAVTLGELERGVEEAADLETRSDRTATLRFAREDLDVVWLEEASRQPTLFGQLAAAVSRKVSRNDCWIAAAAAEARDVLVTQDHRLATQLEKLREDESVVEPLRRLQVTYCPR